APADEPLALLALLALPLPFTAWPRPLPFMAWPRPLPFMAWPLADGVKATVSGVRDETRLRRSGNRPQVSPRARSIRLAHPGFFSTGSAGSAGRLRAHTGRSSARAAAAS